MTWFFRVCLHTRLDDTCERQTHEDLLEGRRFGDRLRDAGNLSGDSSFTTYKKNVILNQMKQLNTLQN